MADKVLLHACCGPCATTCNEILFSEGSIPIIFWFNPNIEPKVEHDKRLVALNKFARLKGLEVISEYEYDIENENWHEAVAGLESEKEGGERCRRCIEFRLKKSLKKAEEIGVFFSTTLSVSPHKNSKMINDIGKGLSGNYLERDFKKNSGYLRSVELSKKYDLYRQNYCGCRYSQKNNRQANS